MRKTTFKLVIALMAGGLISCASEAEQPNIAADAPQFELPALTGETISLQQFQGKFVVIHFATTW